MAEFASWGRVPSIVPAIESDTEAHGFTMASDRHLGAFLRSLVASKSAGRILELGTGTGLSAAWLLDGMDAGASLLTVDNDDSNVAVARRRLGQDPRIRFRVDDGAQVLQELNGRRYDLIFADTWPGKFWDADLALELVAPGGFYVIDDLLPQPDWSNEHKAKVSDLLAFLADYPDMITCQMNGSSGLLVATRRTNPDS